MCYALNPHWLALSKFFPKNLMVFSLQLVSILTTFKYCVIYIITCYSPLNCLHCLSITLFVLFSCPLHCIALCLYKFSPSIFVLCVFPSFYICPPQPRFCFIVLFHILLFFFPYMFFSFSSFLIWNHLVHFPLHNKGWPSSFTSGVCLFTPFKFLVCVCLLFLLVFVFIKGWCFFFLFVRF